MGNQIAIRMHTEHGQEVICESRGHLVDWEMAMVSAFSGCQLRTVYADRGILTWPLIQKVYLPGLHYPLADRADLARKYAQSGRRHGDAARSSGRDLAGAADAGLPVHLDGARIFNAATALAFRSTG